MGNLSLTELVEDIKFQFGENVAWSSPTDYYTRWFNTAYIRLTTQDRLLGLNKSFYFPQLETSSTVNTVDGTAYIAVPTDCLVVRDIHDTTNDRRLIGITPRTYVDSSGRTDTSSEGEPSNWVRQGTSLYLYPTPDAVYTMRIYYRKIPAILSGTEVTAIGAEWDEPLITLATYIGKMWTMDYEKAKILKDEFREQAAGILTIYGEEAKAREEFLAVDDIYRDRSY